jgi:hypothetical protein
LAGIGTYGNSIPAGTVGGDLFEYINFQQRYNIDGRSARALKLAKLYLDPLPAGQPARNMVNDHVAGWKLGCGYLVTMEVMVVRVALHFPLQRNPLGRVQAFEGR